MLRAVLNRHPNIAICDETYFFYYVYSRRDAFGDLAREDHRRRLVDAYLSTWRIRRLGLEQMELTSRLVRDGTSYEALFASLLEAYAESRSKPRAGEKTPQHAEHVETLLKWFPQSTIVHVVRDPRDVVASLRKVPWGRRSTEANARLWVSLVTAAERFAGRRGFHTLRYEDLVGDPEASLSALCRILGEAFDPALLRNGSDEMPDRPWFSRAYEQPISENRIGAWKRDLSEGRVRVIESIAGSLMRPFGYEPIMPAVSRMQRLSASWFRGLEGIQRRLADLPASWFRWLQPTNLAAEEAWIDRRANRRLRS